MDDVLAALPAVVFLPFVDSCAAAMRRFSSIVNTFRSFGGDAIDGTELPLDIDGFMIEASSGAI